MRFLTSSDLEMPENANPSELPNFLVFPDLSIFSAGDHLFVAFKLDILTRKQ